MANHIFAPHVEALFSNDVSPVHCFKMSHYNCVRAGGAQRLRALVQDQEYQVHFPAAHCILQPSIRPSSRGPNTLTHTCNQNTNAHKICISLKLELQMIVNHEGIFKSKPLNHSSLQSQEIASFLSNALMHLIPIWTRTNWFKKKKTFREKLT